jgi:hypothetical protein
MRQAAIVAVFAFSFLGCDQAKTKYTQDADNTAHATIVEQATAFVKKLGGSVDTYEGYGCGVYLVGAKLGDADMKDLAVLKHITSLNIAKTQISNHGLKELAGFQHLESLNLGGTQISDAGLKELASLKKQLTTLVLIDTKIGDAGLWELAPLKQLQCLLLGGTQISDAGLKALTPFQELENLALNNTKIGDAGLKYLFSGPPLPFFRLQPKCLAADTCFLVAPRT